MKKMSKLETVLQFTKIGLMLVGLYLFGLYLHNMGVNFWPF